MECPKCHKIISDNATMCPHCHKVLALICPNCHSYSKHSVCDKCGYIILEKCAKCGKLVPTANEKCKCGLSTRVSVANRECELDEFASITVKFNELNNIKNKLASPDLFDKFTIKLKNLIKAQIKGLEGNIFLYGNTYEINLNKELSFLTSVDKAIKLAIKILNAFCSLNMKLQEEFESVLGINVIIQRKKSEELLINKSVSNNVKQLLIKQGENKYLKGMQIILDQYIQEYTTGEYKTDSLYMIEQDGIYVMYYELLLDNYVIPPTAKEDEKIEATRKDIPKKEERKQDLYGFKVLDISAKCKFERCYADVLTTRISLDEKIIAIKGDKELQTSTAEILDFYKKNKIQTIYVSCSKEMNYKPWGFFEKVFKDYYGLSTAKGLINPERDFRRFNNIKDFIFGNIAKTSSPEDARFTYIEMFVSFLMSMKNCVIVIDGFEMLDDTTIQALELYFDKFKQINTRFVFITDSETSVHSKIKGLLRTPLYKEFTMEKCDISALLSNLKEDAEDFVKSFYYEKIKENFNGSNLYFEHALNYLTDKDVIINFEGKLIIKSNNSVMLPKNLKSLIKARLRFLGKNQDASMILAYSTLLGERLDFELLEKLEINNVQENAKTLEKMGFVYIKGSVLYINNYSLIRTMFEASLKDEIVEYLAKNIIAKAGKIIDDTTLLNLMGKISQYKEQYLLLWKNAQTSIAVGDYDAYLTNSLGFLSIAEKLGENIPKETIENNKKDVYHNILMSLYNYSPAKIYSIENILLADSISTNNKDDIAKLSNLMLQGALISANYTDASSLLHNILENMENPLLVVDGVVNTRFLLLSLVNIEILFNMGEFRSCIEIGNKLLSVIKPNIIEKIKPVNFSVNLFVSHLLDTFRLVGFAKLISMDDDIEDFFNSIKLSFNEELPERDCITEIMEFLSGKKYTPSLTEEATPFSKAIFLILQELSAKRKDYKLFAQNVYQAKLLACDLHQTQLEYICDLLIAYAYGKLGITVKAIHIYNDVLEKSEMSAIYNTKVISNYMLAKIKLTSGEVDEALIIINNSLDEIQKRGNQAKIFYAMFEKLYIDTMKNNNIKPFDIITEQQRLLSVVSDGRLEYIIKSSEFVTTKEDPDELAQIAEDLSEPESSTNTQVHK